MNDFTKEELQKIDEALGSLPIRWNGWGKRWKTDLQVKIQSMIDNYCEHDYIETGYICHKCNAELK